MGLLRLAVFTLAFAGFGWNANAGQASSRLSALSDSLIKGYLAKLGEAKATLAIFPFNCEEKLEKWRVGFAISELMSNRFVADGTFTVLERGEIGKLLNEQKLQASGAVDSDTAVRLGKLLGARLLLLGNVQKVDGRYQVNARLVDAETSAVMVSGYEELPIGAFEDDARPYLNLVPEEQALGIYFLYNTRYNSNDLPSQSLGSGTLVPKEFTLAMMGIGMKYAPTTKLLADVSYLRTTADAVTANSWWDFQGKLAVDAIRARLEYRLNRSRRLMYYAGAGMTFYTMHMEGKTTYTSPMLSIRAEYRPQSRIGLSFSCNYDINNEPAIMQGSARGALLNKLSFEPSLSMYF